jgi:tetratricopeptide (TPR) repeat protein
MKTVVSSLLLAACLPFCAQAQTEAFSSSYKLEARKQYAAAAQPLKALAEAGNEFASMRLAWLAYLEGKHEIAERGYKELLERKPNIIDARLGLMLPLMALKRWDDAIAQGEMVLTQSAWDYVAHTRLLACHEALGQWEKVELHAKALSEAFPSDPTALVYLARAKVQKGDAPGAKDAYLQVLQRAPANPEANTFMVKNAPATKPKG